MIDRAAKFLALCLMLFGTACMSIQLPGTCGRGTLGIEPGDISREFREMHALPAGMQGSVVAMAIEGGPAATAGVLAGDVLLEIRSKQIRNSCDAVNALFDGRCDPATLVVWRDGARRTITMNPVPERNFYQTKISEKLPAAYFRLAWLWENGEGKAGEEAFARGMYSHACDDGWAESCAYLGYSLMEASAENPSMVKAFERACALGSSAGCAHLAYLYATGTGVERDDAKATPLYVKSCDLGDPLGCYNVGLMYNEGRGVPADQARAIAAYEEGCRGGSSFACTDLGWYYERGEGVPEDPARAAELYKQGCDGTSCQAANLRGCVNLALSYRDGIGMTPDPAQAFEILRATCVNDPEAGNDDAREMRAHACSLLGSLYLTGQGVDQDNDAGLTYSAQGCDGGDAFGCFNAGVIFSNGLGVDVDMAKAAEYYQDACDDDDGESCYNLSLLYANGNGVDLDEERAKELAEKACRLDFEAACGNAERRTE